ncbi:MAG: hypothetical protein BGO30_07270 [Bacteroidetes bacterium 41-46]|nr:MAG: hypothetical protein BGO30_07270 [Bacteroidetes bacterium 41-46]
MSTLGSIDWVNLGSIIMVPISSVISYLAGKRIRNNDFLQQLQASIDMLAKKNATLLEELVTVKEQYADVKLELKKVSKENLQLKEGMLKLTEENKSFSKQVEVLTEQLANVKVITKVERAPHV